MKKKIVSLLITIFTICTLMFTLTACTSKVEFKINFVVDGEVYAVVNTNGKEIIKMPQDPSKEDYNFDGWFWDKDVWEKIFTANSLLDAPLSSNMNVYAKFSLIHVCAFTEEVANNDYIATNATCEERATYYYSCTCGEKGTETFESGEALGHSFTNYVFNNDATCLEDGTETALCDNDCGKDDTRTKTGSTSNHNFSTPTYVWNGNECTATRICSRDSAHVETETVAASYVKDIDKTCITAETGHYLATFENTAFVVQTTAKDSVTNGEALGHLWDLWKTNTNGTHTRTCLRDSEHKENGNCSGGTATCIQLAKCSLCNSEYGNYKNHQAKEEWTITEKEHYHICKTSGCTEKLDKEKHTFDKNKQCIVCGYATTELLWTEISSEVFEINGANLYAKVANSQTTFYFGDVIQIAEGATFKVYADAKGTIELTTYMSNLFEGDNTFYIAVTNSGSLPKIYTATVRRRPMYIVDILINGGTAVKSQTVEEGFCAIEPTAKRDGYTFTGWDYDFATPITQNTTINAIWSANTDTKYVVQYYLQNIEDDNYTLDSTRSYQTVGTTDTTATVIPEEIQHFTFDEHSSVLKGSIDGNGTLVLKVYYDRKTYNLSTNDFYAGSVTNTGSYKYGKEITATVTLYLGYDFLGWYSDETLLSTNLEYSATATQNVMAKFDLKEEMSNFYFSSTATSCEITHIIDNSVTEIIIPDYVTSITGIFYKNRNLKSVVIGDGITSIDDDAFYYCTSLTSVVIGNGITSIGSCAFYECTNLTSINIPYGVTSIGSYAFYYCDSLKSITVPDSVIEIGLSAFFGCNSLTEMTLPFVGETEKGTRNTRFGHIFYENYSYNVPDSLKKVTITGGASIDKNAFSNCDSLTSIIIPDSVTSIGSYAFSGCSSLTSITIPNSVTTIGEYAFNHCSGLTRIEIPDSVTSIGGHAFYKCTSITKVNYLGTIDSWVQIEFENSYSNPICNAKNLYISNKLVSEAYLRTATKISNYAFYNCSSLTSISISDSVTSIGSYAFYNCSNLDIIKFRNYLDPYDTWYHTNNITDWNNKTNGESASAGFLIVTGYMGYAIADETYFTSTYCSHYWYKK